MMQKIKDTNLLLKSRKRFLLIIAVVILTIAYMTSTFSHKRTPKKAKNSKIEHLF